MKKLLLTSVHLLKKVAPAVIACCLLLVGNRADAQIITENGFEEIGWTTHSANTSSSSRTATTDAAGNPISSVTSTIPVFSNSTSSVTTAGGSKYTNTYTFYSARTGLITSTVTNSYSSTNNTGGSTTGTYTQTWFGSLMAVISNNVNGNSSNYIRTGSRSVQLNGNSRGYIITPVLSGITSISFYVLASTASAANNIQVAINPNLSITGSTGVLTRSFASTASTGSSSSWTGSNYNSSSNATFLTNSFSWYPVSFTTNIPGNSSVYLKIQNVSATAGADLYIDDIVITQPLPPVTYNFYRPVGTGSLATPLDWNTASNWEGSADGSTNWTVCTSIPSGAGTVNIPTGHFVTIDATTTIPTTNVVGYLKYSAATTVAGGSTLTVANGATVEHAQNGTSFVVATWQAGSTLKITGTFTPASNDLTIGTYQNIWFAGSINSGSYFRLANGSANTINGELKVTSTGPGDLLISSINNATGQTVGSFVQTGGNVMANRDGGSGTRALTVTGNVDVSGGILYIKQGSTNATIGALNVGGNVTVSGTGSIIKSGTGTANINLNGSSQQTITGLTGAGTSGTINITTNNATNILLGSNMDIGAAATLTVSAGTLNLNGNTVTLKSDATGTARLAAVTTGAIDQSVSGSQFAVERYIAGGPSVGTPGKRAFRFFGHPFNDYIDLRQLTNQIDITGTGATLIPSGVNFTQLGTNAPSAFRFDPLLADNQASDAGWQAFTNTLPVNGSDDNAWKVSQGIRVFVRGAKGEGPSGNYTASNVTLNMTGKVNVATSPIGVTLVKNGIVGTGWNLVGNPLPSQIEIQAKLKALRDADIVNQNNIGAIAYVWNPNKALTSRGGYDAIDLTVAGSYYLPMNAVVVVQTLTNGNTALTFSESDKSSNTGASLFRTTGTNNTIALGLEDASGNQLDETFIRFNSKAKNKFESNDGGKLLNEFSLYSLTEDKVMAYINSLPEAAADSRIVLGIYSNATKDFVIRATDLNLPTGTTAYLNDKYLNKQEEITGTSYAYHFNTTVDAASKGNGRFELLFKTVPLLPVLNSTFSIKLSPNPATALVKVSFSNEEQANTTITIMSADGKTVKTVDAGNVQSGEISINIKSLAKGSYFVTMNNGKEKKTEKLQVQ